MAATTDAGRITSLPAIPQSPTIRWTSPWVNRKLIAGASLLVLVVLFARGGLDNNGGAAGTFCVARSDAFGAFPSFDAARTRLCAHGAAFGNATHQNYCV